MITKYRLFRRRCWCWLAFDEPPMCRFRMHFSHFSSIFFDVSMCRLSIRAAVAFSRCTRVGWLLIDYDDWCAAGFIDYHFLRRRFSPMKIDESTFQNTLHWWGKYRVARCRSHFISLSLIFDVAKEIFSITPTFHISMPLRFFDYWCSRPMRGRCIVAADFFFFDFSPRCGFFEIDWGADFFFADKDFHPASRHFGAAKISWLMTLRGGRFWWLQGHFSSFISRGASWLIIFLMFS